jgi:pyrroloquinoline quinone biosynthesis protein D
MPLPPIDGGARFRLARKARLRWDEREQRHLLLYPERGLLLNATGGAIAQLLDGRRTVEEVAAALAASLQGEAPADLEGEVRRFLERLRDRGLLEVAP